MGASLQHFHLAACAHPQHCMSTLAAAILAGSRCPRRSHAIMHPRSHDSLNYTDRTGGCRGTAAHYIMDVQCCDLLLMIRYQVITEPVLWIPTPIEMLSRYKMSILCQWEQIIWSKFQMRSILRFLCFDYTSL